MSDAFESTRWTLVLAAKGEGSREALEWLCRTYWFPLYAFIRRQGHGSEASRDLTQAFFLSLIERSALSAVDRSLGKFRAFLLASAKNFLSNHKAWERAAKRGEALRVFPVDLEAAERAYARNAVPGLGPEELYEARWARALLERAVRRLRDDYEARGHGEIFRHLQGHLTGDEAPYELVGVDLGLEPGAVRVAVHRLRKRLGALLREEVAQTLSNDEDIDAELRYLLAAAGRGA